MSKKRITLKGRVRVIMRDAKTNEIVRVYNWTKNIIPSVGITAILNRLGDEAATANEGIITYGAVGTGASTPVAGDTTMLAEYFRKAIATTTVAGATLTVETFLAAGEGNTTLTQYALFGEDASAAADSGTMFEYDNFEGSIVKTTAVTLTIQSEITITEEEEE
jgi:hypothetical protein